MGKHSLSCHFVILLPLLPTFFFPLTTFLPDQFPSPDYYKSAKHFSWHDRKSGMKIRGEYNVKHCTMCTMCTMSTMCNIAKYLRGT